MGSRPALMQANLKNQSWHFDKLEFANIKDLPADGGALQQALAVESRPPYGLVLSMWPCTEV